MGALIELLSHMDTLAAFSLCLMLLACALVILWRRFLSRLLTALKDCGLTFSERDLRISVWPQCTELHPHTLQYMHIHTIRIHIYIQIHYNTYTYNTIQA
jgi:hypothetical protein